jgi:hypothetical protein
MENLNESTLDSGYSRQITIQELDNEIVNLKNSLSDLRTKYQDLNNRFLSTIDDKLHSQEKRQESKWAFWKNDTKERLTKLEDDIKSIRRDLIKSLLLENELMEIKEKQAKIITHYNKLLGASDREQRGGKIPEIQHQDLLSLFRNIIQNIDTFTANHTQSIGGFKERNEFKSSLAKIFEEDWKFEKWSQDIILFPSFGIIERTKDDTDKILQDLENLYNEVESFKKKMVNLTPKADFFFPSSNKIDSNTEEVIHEKCNSDGFIEFIVYPGYKIGDKVEIKAKVFTSDDSQTQTKIQP